MSSSGWPPPGCTVGDVIVDTARIRYVLGERGRDTVVLIHDWPETGHAWRHVMPLLAPDHTVLTVDLRGAGGSSAPPRGYDKQHLARDVRGVVATLGLRRPVLVGHGIGGMVAFSYAGEYPRDTAGVVLVDAALPAIAGWTEAGAGRSAWHLGFHTHRDHGDGIAEQLVTHNQMRYFRSFIDRFAAHPERISDVDVAVYAAAAVDADHLRAGFELFRSLPVDELHTATSAAPVDVPIVLAYGEYSLATLLEIVADGLRARGVHEVRTVSVTDSGHWIPEEQPARLASLIADFVHAVSAAGR